jgi:hypothetical protein
MFQFCSIGRRSNWRLRKCDGIWIQLEYVRPFMPGKTSPSPRGWRILGTDNIRSGCRSGQRSRHDRGGGPVVAKYGCQPELDVPEDALLLPVAAIAIF